MPAPHPAGQAVCENGITQINNSQHVVLGKTHGYPLTRRKKYAIMVENAQKTPGYLHPDAVLPLCGSAEKRGRS
jgi:hypothetical protein